MHELDFDLISIVIPGVRSQLAHLHDGARNVPAQAKDILAEVP
jgi:hypothetical protein